MTAIRTSQQNAYEGTLTAEMGPNDLSVSVDGIGALTSPCYLVIEMDSDTQREYIYFNDPFTGSSFATSNGVNRYLAGSAAGSNLTHPIGTKIRTYVGKQQHDDLHDRIDGMDHGTLEGLNDDDHPQYLLDADHTKNLHDAMEIDAGTLDNIDSTGFSLAAHDHPGEFAPASHVGEGGIAHADVIAFGADGFMTGADKAKLDAIAAGANLSMSEVQALMGHGGVDDFQDTYTSHSRVTFIKPSGWGTFDLLVTATCYLWIPWGDIDVGLFTSARIGGVAGTEVSLSGRGYTMVSTVQKVTGLAAHVEVDMYSKSDGLRVYPKWTPYSCVAVRTS